jgi:hypothetical protein
MSAGEFYLGNTLDMTVKLMVDWKEAFCFPGMVHRTEVRSVSKAVQPNSGSFSPSFLEKLGINIKLTTLIL